MAGRINILCRAAGDDLGQAHSYFALGTAVRARTETIRNLEQAEHLYRNIGFRLDLADALLQLHDRGEQSEMRESRIEVATRLYSECGFGLANS